MEVNVVAEFDEAQYQLIKKNHPLSEEQYKTFRKILKKKGKNLKAKEEFLAELMLTNSDLLFDDKLWENNDGLGEPVMLSISPELAHSLSIIVGGIVVV